MVGIYLPNRRRAFRFRNEKSFEFDGVNDHLIWNAILAAIATSTVGALSIWIKVPASDDNSQRTYFSISNNASAIVTELSFLIDFREATGGFPGNSLALLAIANDTNQWIANAGADFINTHIGNWINIVISHNATTPVLYVNAAPVSLNFEVSTDKTFWFKGAITDTAPVSDVGSIGAIRRNGSVITPYNSNIDEVAIYNGALSGSEVTAIYNSRRAIDLEKLSSSSKLVSTLRMGDDLLDDATSGTGVIKDQVASNDATPMNTLGNNIKFDVAS